MGLPEYAFSDDDVLTPDDVTDELLERFDRHCRRTEGSVFSGAVASRASSGGNVRTRPPVVDLDDDADLLAEIMR